MKSIIQGFCFVLFSLSVTVAFAQVPENVTVNNNDDFPDFTKLGGGDTKPANKPANTPPAGSTTTTTPPAGGGSTLPGGIKVEKVENLGEIPPDKDAPLDGIVERKTIVEKEVLPWEPVRESDVMWSLRVWRVIDVREKMNLHFIYPEANFFTLLMKGIRDSSATAKPLMAYKGDNDKFQYKFTPEEVKTIGGSQPDTIETVDPITYETKYKVIEKKLNPEDIKRYRIKEDWFFDRQYSTLKVRILGIAPLQELKNEDGSYLAEMPLFWVRYPDCREYLARQRAFIEGNDSNPMSWEDIFEMRLFSSHIIKSSNVHARRLENYLTGIDILLEGEKIKSEIFNFEHDLWSY